MAINSVSKILLNFQGGTFPGLMIIHLIIHIHIIIIINYSSYYCLLFTFSVVPGAWPWRSTMPSLHGQAPGAIENNTYRGRRLGLQLLLPINVVEVQSGELIIPSSHSNCDNHPDRAR